MLLMCWQQVSLTHRRSCIYILMSSEEIWFMYPPLLELPGKRILHACHVATCDAIRFCYLITGHYTVNACLSPVVSMHGLAVTTVEGIGSTKSRLHPVQERLAKSHGSQCGFCTPGIVMSMYTLLRNSPSPTMEEIEESLAGNLCRCTGYRPILESFRTFSSDSVTQVAGCGKKDCCQLKKKSSENNEGSNEKSPVMEGKKILYDPSLFAPYHPSQDIIFPPELMNMPELSKTSLVFVGPRVKHFRPTSLNELVHLKELYPHSKLVVGNTEVGIEVKYKNQNYPVTISPSEICELHQVGVCENGVEVGSSLCLSSLEKELSKIIAQEKEWRTRCLVSILEMLRWFAGRQIRNTACLGGNIMTSSPISDLNPIFLAAGAILKVRSKTGEREITMDENFFTGYRKNIIDPTEVLISIRIPFTKEHEYFYAYKQSRRREDDIAIVNAAFSAEFEPKSNVVKRVKMAFGGMAATSVMATATMESLRGRSWNAQTAESTISALLKELQVHPSAPGGMVDYRRALAASFFFKFYLSSLNCLSSKYPNLVTRLTDDELKVTQKDTYHPTSSLQLFQETDNGDNSDPVGQPIAHLSAELQCTGEAVYVDDMPKFHNEHYGAVVTSNRARAKIIEVDESEAMKFEGVVGFFSAKDLSAEQNLTGVAQVDEEIFASEEVCFIGQIIGVVVAKDPAVADRAAKAVKVTYEDMKPIITIQDAIDANSSFGTWSIESGNPEDVLAASKNTLAGESYIGGQEHFYLETNAHIAVPHEGDEMELFSSSQNPTASQKMVAKALGYPLNRVVVRVKRMGGGFGGKETRTCMISVPLAIAAQRLQVPVRLMLDRHQDMCLTGTRHPFLARWRVSFGDDGTVTAFHATLYCNAGSSLDLSAGVLQRSLFSITNAYKIPNMSVTGVCCKTNMPSNTAFRGFGGPQGMFVMEDVLSKVSDYLNIHPVKIREAIMYSPQGDRTHFGQLIENCTQKRCWDQVLKTSHFNQREKEVQKFNKVNRYKSRGISAIPTMFGIAYTATFLNQAGALIHVYTDGSVLLSHGGTEMGQGLHVKMVQVASKTLNIPLDRIYITETSTDKVPNTSPTAASSSSDLNGMAVLDACNKILSRLEPFREKDPNGGWNSWVNSAYFERVSLSATGFYRTPGIEQYQFDNKPGKPFNYFCFGAAVSEVEIDCLTGHHEILRTDVVMDVGSSLNPAIDIGQIEGGFLQGVGMMTTEELRYSPEGVLLTRGPGAYKIPSFQDIPREFNVSLLKNCANPKAVYSSKAIGEPPLFLAASVFFAIRNAVNVARSKNASVTTNADEGTEKSCFNFHSPATVEQIRMACEDHITKQITPAEPGTFKPWSISV